MPELPEVETVARQLAPVLEGRKVKSIDVLDRKLANPSFRKLQGARISHVERLGKTVVISFSPRSFLQVHLRMTGRLLWQSAGKTVGEINYVNPTSKDPKHVRFRLNCVGGELQFADVRRFGTLELVDKKDQLKLAGIDPLSESFTKRRFAELVEGSRQEAKVWLMRQDKLVGIGNIYASEILHRARISPTVLIGELDSSELGRIYNATRSILKKAIEHCGTTFSDFQDTTGSTGSYQKYLKVYGREGERCKRCGSQIERIVQAQRSTFFCSYCCG